MASNESSGSGRGLLERQSAFSASGAGYMGGRRRPAIHRQRSGSPGAYDAAPAPGAAAAAACTRPHSPHTSGLHRCFFWLRWLIMAVQLWKERSQSRQRQLAAGSACGGGRDGRARARVSCWMERRQAWGQRDAGWMQDGAGWMQGGRGIGRHGVVSESRLQITQL